MSINHVCRRNFTISLKSFSKSFKRYPIISPKSHLPTFIWLLSFTTSLILLSISVAIISPAVFLQLSPLISSFIFSTFMYSFWRISLHLIISPANFSYWPFMYSLIYFSLSLNDSSMMWLILSLKLLNSSTITLYIRLLKFSILKLMLVISFRISLLRFSKHWADSIRAD